MQELITTALKHFNYMADQLVIDGHLFSFNNDKTVCVIGVPRERCLHIYLLKDDSWVEEYIYDLKKSQLASNENYSLSSISINGDNTQIALGFVNRFGDRGACILLRKSSISLAEVTAIYPSIPSLNGFGTRVYFAKNTNVLLISSPDYTPEDGTIKTGAVFVYKIESDDAEDSYKLVTMFQPDDRINVNDFGKAIVVSDDASVTAVLGNHDAVGLDESYDELVLTVFTPKGFTEIFTGQIADVNDRYFLTLIPGNLIVLTGLPYYMANEPIDSKAEQTFQTRHEIVYRIDGGQLIMVSDKRNSLYDLLPRPEQSISDLTDTSMPVISEQISVHNLKQQVGLDDIPERVSTDQLKIDKDKTMLRHHLIIQNLLNNIALAVKNKEPVNVRIKGLEITPERVKISMLEFVNSTDDKES